MAGVFSKPKVQQAPQAPQVVEVKQPVVNEEIVNRNASDLARRRRGSGATVTGAGESGTTAGSVAAKTLLGQ